MIVCVGEHFQISRQELPEQFDPVDEVTAPIHDRFVPSFGPLFYSSSISKPAHIDKVRGNEIELFLELPGARHGRQILEHKGDSMFAQKIGENRIKPRFVSYLDSEFVIRRKFLKKWFQHLKKILLRRKLPSVEVWKLEDQGPQFVAENTHGIDEFMEFCLAINQRFLVGYSLRHLRSEDEI